MAINLVVRDNRDGSGGTAILTGTPPGGVNTLYAAPWTGVAGPLAWSQIGTSTVDNSFAIGPPTGYFVWLATSAAGGSAAVSPLVFGAFTDAAARSVLDRILDAVVVRLKSLNLANVQPGNIVRQWVNRTVPNDPQPPRIVVCPLDTEDYPESQTGRDTITYTVGVFLIDAQNQDATLAQARNMLWRERVSRAFRLQTLAGVPEVYSCKVAGGFVIDSENFKQNWFVSHMALHFYSNEPRGFM